MAGTTWQNAFDLGACVVSVYCNASGGGDVDYSAPAWSGSMAEGDSNDFDDPAGGGNTLTIAVSDAGNVSLVSANSLLTSGRQFLVDVQPTGTHTGTRVANLINNISGSQGGGGA